MLIDLWLTRNEIYFNICKNAAFTISIEWKVVDKRGKILKENHQIFLWLADDALCLLWENNLCLIDRTYLIALHLFYQALVIMNFDRVTSYFFRCVFALVCRKSERLYLHLFHEIIDMLNLV
ncbi:hypothetical protein MXB_5571 [Myxobolus squamalis]|nr:hypothetical protein MXB_5571 [Myxobolus squamalis]